MRNERWIPMLIGMMALGGVAACADGDPVAPEAPRMGLGLSMNGDGHEEPDPRIPPMCDGQPATIWWNMPADRVPAGAVVRPVVAGGDDPHEHQAAPDGDAADDAPGYVIIGTVHRDVIVGSPKRDSIDAGNGNDVVCADPVRGGEDDGGHEGVEPSVHAPGGQGGGGPDKVWGGNGDDRLWGGGGPDTIRAGNGDDVVYGGGGPDALYGENGNDALYGGPGPDLLDGGRGEDLLDPGSSHDGDGGHGIRDVLVALRAEPLMTLESGDPLGVE